MELRQYPIDARVYLVDDIVSVANQLSSLEVNTNKSFLESLMKAKCSMNSPKDCLEFHLDDIKYDLAFMYEQTEDKPASFLDLIGSAMLCYLCAKVSTLASNIAYNYLINYVNDNKLNTRVSYDMVDIITHDATMETKPQELIDKLHSFLEGK